MTASIVSTELLQEETTGADCTWVEVLRCKNAVTAEVAFFNHIFLCRGDHDGSFRARTEFMHTSSVPPSWRRTYTIHTNLLRPTASVWDPLSNSCPTLLMKAQGDLKAHISYIKTSSQAVKQVKSSGKLMSAHTVSQRGKKPMTEGRPARNMQESASATLCFTCASSQSHCERSQSIGGTYHVPGGK